MWDILIGSFVLLFAIAPLLSRSLGDFWSTVIFLPFWALVFIVIWLIRKYIVIPRIGFVKFGALRKKKLTTFSIVMLVINLIAFIIGIFFQVNFNVKSGPIYTVIFSLIVLGMSSMAAYFLNFTRLLIYGLLFFVSFSIGEWLFINYKFSHHGYPVTFGSTAGIIIITGLIIFFRLLKENPLPVSKSIAKEKIG